MSDEYCIKDWKVCIRTRLYAESDVYVNYTLQVVSKKFWFIERLVIYAKVKYWPIEELTTFNKDWKMYWYTDTLLMHLAIQDDPISFLVSVLK